MLALLTAVLQNDATVCCCYNLHVRHLRIVLGNIVHTSLDGLLLSIQGVLRICNRLVFLELKSKIKKN